MYQISFHFIIIELLQFIQLINTNWNFHFNQLTSFLRYQRFNDGLSFICFVLPYDNIIQVLGRYFAICYFESLQLDVSVRTTTTKKCFSLV